MKLFSYIRYFLYLSWYWNPLLAGFIIYYEIKGERKYKLHTTGYDELNELKKQGIDITHASMYMPANYYMLEKLLQELRSKPNNDCLLDIGCGKGRVLIIAAHWGFSKLYGVELSPSFCEVTKANIAVQQKSLPEVAFRIIQQNASNFIIPDEVSTIFLYNPFDAVIMKHVVEHITDSLQRKPRTLYIAYMNPLEKNLFLAAGFKEIFHHKKLNLLEGDILEYNHP